MATARRFAAALGMIAFAWVTGFGIIHASRLEWVLLRALVAMGLFSALGYVIGWLGAAVARESAAREIERRVDAEESKRAQEKTE
jgi:NhaP-type Na+/H+ or K+/H+ antiporter